MTAAQKIVLRFLEQGPATIAEVKEHLHCSYEYARRVVLSLPVRVARWAKIGSSHVRVFSLGGGEDAPRPPKQTIESRREVARRCMRDLRNRRKNEQRPI